MSSILAATPLSRQIFYGFGEWGVLCAVLMLCAWVTRDGLAEQTASRPRAKTTAVATTAHFEFHSDPWINLHHFLYQWARADAGLGEGRRRVPVPERSSLADLSSEQRSRWLRAVGFYRDSVAARSHWDPEMLRMKRELLNLDGSAAAAPPDVISGISAALTLAMPIYQERWWPEHDKANRRWISSLAPRLRRHEARFVQMTRRVYGAVWPDTRWRVDVSAYANWKSGYTTTDGHTVIYSTDPSNQGLYALEAVFHEVQHAQAVGGSIPVALDHAFERTGTKPPENLWHALIFETAGTFTQSVAAAEGLPEHTPYWIKEGFENLEGWSTLVPAVRRQWRPVVRGEVSTEAGLAALARDLRSR